MLVLVLVLLASYTIRKINLQQNRWVPVEDCWYTCTSLFCPNHEFYEILVLVLVVEPKKSIRIYSLLFVIILKKQSKHSK